MSWARRRAVPLAALGASVAGGAAYRFLALTDSSEASLNPHTFTPYTLLDKQPVSSTSAIFTLRNRDGAAEPESVREVWKRSVWSVQIKQPQLQIARAYTPLPPRVDGNKTSKDEPAEIRLLIRHERSGEVSTYLHRLPEQATIELRGPNTEFKLPQNIKEVIFLAGGTGIAPAMQVARALGKRTGSTMHILWANRRREECIGGVSDIKDESEAARDRIGWWKSMFSPGDSSEAQKPLDDTTTKGVIVKELDALKARSNSATNGLQVQYYVDEEQTFIQQSDVAKRLRGRPEEKGSRLIIVSGPEAFIEHWAGRKVWVGGQETQGPVGGVLGTMDLREWKVFKL